MSNYKRNGISPVQSIQFNILILILILILNSNIETLFLHTHTHSWFEMSNFDFETINLNLGRDDTRSDAAAHKQRSEVFIPASAIDPSKPPQILIDYPVSDDFYFALAPLQDKSVGLTVGELIDRVLDIYDEVYAEEERTSSITPGYIPGMLNRNRTDGKYGVYGHVLSDLYWGSAHYEAKSNHIVLGIDS